MDFDIDQCEEMVNKNIKSLMGKDTEKEAAKFLNKVEDVNSLLQELMSKDKETVIINFCRLLNNISCLDLSWRLAF